MSNGTDETPIESAIEAAKQQREKTFDAISDWVCLIDEEYRIEKSESLKRLAGAIAHHFNNQLSVIMGNLELAMLDLRSLFHH